MKKFLAIYLGTPEHMEKSGWNALSEKERKEKEAAGMQAWCEWAERNGDAIVDAGNPLGSTRRAAKDGITGTRNAMCAYTIVQAESHEAAAQLFNDHPHFAVFPGESVEIMECLPLPEQAG